MSGKNAGTGQATVAKVKIKGVSGAKINDVDVVITLNGNVTFKYIGADDDVTDWFGNDMSAIGLDAVVTSLSADSKVITITVSGIPGNWKADALSITIPEGNNTSDSDIDVDENDDARYDIAMPITSDTEFAAFVNEVNTNGKVTLSAVLTSGLEIDATTGVDLPIAKNWRTAGKYAGDFDGNNGTIDIDLHGTTSYLALFAINNGTIHDLTVIGNVTLDEDETSTDADYIAGVVAYNDIEGHINHVIADVEVMAYADGEPEIAHNIGGIAGFNGWDPFNDDSPHAGEDWEKGGFIFQCRNEGAIEGGFNKIGGIVGENANIIEQCVNTGKITCKKGAEVRGWPGVGGIAGRNGNNNISQEQGQIIDCYSWGTIVDNTATGTEQNAYGCITGWCDVDSTVKNCFTTGEFSETGGFRGSKNPIIGMVDQELPAMSIDNYSLETVDASSTDVPLTGYRKSETYMQSEDFVNNDLNKYGVVYKYNGPDDFPTLLWESN